MVARFLYLVVLKLVVTKKNPTKFAYFCENAIFWAHVTELQPLLSKIQGKPTLLYYVELTPFYKELRMKQDE